MIELDRVYYGVMMSIEITRYRVDEGKERREEERGG
jgi:hypothetical protein